MTYQKNIVFTQILAVRATKTINLKTLCFYAHTYSTYFLRTEVMEPSQLFQFGARTTPRGLSKMHQQSLWRPGASSGWSCAFILKNLWSAHALLSERDAAHVTRFCNANRHGHYWWSITFVVGHLEQTSKGLRLLAPLLSIAHLYYSLGGLSLVG